VTRAVFLDRDGTINKPVLHRELGLIDAPLREDQFELMPGAASAIQQLNEMGFLVVVVTNQPGVAKGKMSEATLAGINQRMRDLLATEGARLDGVYCCLHHPTDGPPPYRQVCHCRKPSPGLLEIAAQEHNLDLATSYMVGDSYTDILAGQAAGCRSILVGGIKCDSCRLMQEEGARPDAIAANLAQVAEIIRSWERASADIHR
jgi:D-glycero-D-manno-heptose 1,7-bisphosphate phosphatase